MKLPELESGSPKVKGDDPLQTLTHFREHDNIISCISTENGKSSVEPKNREGPSPAERGSAAAGREVHPGARGVMAPGEAAVIGLTG